MSATPSNVEHDVCLNQSLGPFVRALFFHFIGHRLRERLSAAAFLFFPSQYTSRAVFHRRSPDLAISYTHDEQAKILLAPMQTDHPISSLRENKFKCDLARALAVRELRREATPASETKSSLREKNWVKLALPHQVWAAKRFFSVSFSSGWRRKWVLNYDHTNTQSQGMGSAI
jgi:hypothetical protein